MSEPRRLISEADVRGRLVEIFEACRKKPHAPYDEERFLDFLIEPPAKHGQIKNGFAGNLRYVRFIDKVQAEFSVYFSTKDRDTNYSLDGFARRIQSLRQKPEGSVRSLRNSMAHSDSNAVIFANIVLLLFVALSRNVDWLFPFAVAVWLCVNGGFIWFVRRERNYQKALLGRIEKLKAETAEEPTTESPSV
jgi:hypothetical protein